MVFLPHTVPFHVVIFTVLSLDPVTTVLPFADIATEFNGTFDAQWYNNLPTQFHSTLLSSPFPHPITTLFPSADIATELTTLPRQLV